MCNLNCTKLHLKIVAIPQHVSHALQIVVDMAHGVT